MLAPKTLSMFDFSKNRACDVVSQRFIQEVVLGVRVGSWEVRRGRKESPYGVGSWARSAVDSWGTISRGIWETMENACRIVPPKDGKLEHFIYQSPHAVG